MDGYNPYEFMIGGQLPKEDQMKSMAGSLRGQDSRAMLAMMSGDPVLSKVGQAMAAQSRSTAGGLAKTRSQIENLELARQRQASAEEMKKLQMEANEQNRLLLEENRKFNRQMALRKEEAAAKERELENRKDLADTRQKTGIASMESTFKQIDNLIGKYVNKEGRVTKDIPGVGSWDRMAAETAGLNLFVSEEGKQIASAMSMLANMTLKDRSGAAVTTPEFERLRNELQTKIGNNDQDAINAYIRMKEYVGNLSDEITTEYGYPEELTSPTYRSTGTQPIAPTQPSPRGRGQMGRTSSGSSYEVIE